MTTYAGYDVLTIPPNAVSVWGSTVDRVVDRAENEQGNVVTTTRADALRDARTLTWHCATRADLTSLRAVLDARVGQLIPCWIPTYQRDIEVLAIIPFTGVIVTSTASCDRIDTDTTWQNWIVHAPGGAFVATVNWTVATDLGNGTHQLPPGMSFGLTSAAGYIHSRMLFCRLASGAYRVSVRGAVATVTAEFTQLTAGL